MSNGTPSLDIAVAYEMGQLRRGLLRAVLLWVFPLVGIAVGGQVARTFVFGGALFMAATVLGWRGQAWGRAVVPGILAGSIPFLASLASQLLGHVCTPYGCTSLCAPLCSTAGLLSGGLLGHWMLSTRRPQRWISWLGASGLVVGIGTLGCACLGVGSIVGLIGGHMVSTLWFVRKSGG